MRDLRWADADVGVVLPAVLWHDIGSGACEVDTFTLRHPCTAGMIGFAEELLSALP